jgi:hypothetical protein
VDNPFSTRFIAPDRHPFIFPPGKSLSDVGGRLVNQDWSGQIIGPHGSGKSTLLHNLLQWAEGQGGTARFIFLNDQQRRLPQGWTAEPLPTFYAVDGAEQLSWWAWTGLKWQCARHRCGLLVTAHHSLKLPTLFQTGPADPETIRRVVYAIAGSNDTPSPDLSRQLATAHVGNMREILFALYDRWEKRRRTEIEADVPSSYHL